jgi:hypothetical protein
VIGSVREKKNIYRSLVGKVEVMRLLGKPGRRWVTIIIMRLYEMGWQDVG